MLEHGARGEQEEEGAEGKGDGEVAMRKLHDFMGRGKKRGRGGNGVQGFLFYSFSILL
jgi:hypothetical protein